MEKLIRVLFATESEEYVRKLSRPLEDASYNLLNTYININDFLSGSIRIDDHELIILDLTGVVLNANEISLITTFVKKKKGIPFVLIVKDRTDKDHFNSTKTPGFDCLLENDINVLGWLTRHLLSETCLYKELRTAKALNRKEKEHLTTTLASIGDGVITADTEGNITFMNYVAEELTGWKYHDAKGKQIDTVFKIIDKITNQPMGSPFLSTIETGKKSGLKRSSALLSKNGNEYYVSASSSPIRDNKDNVTGLVAVFRDVTRHRNLEDNLVKAKDYYLTLFEKFPALIWRADLQKKCNYFNEGWLNFTGRTLEQELGDGWVEGVHPEDTEMCFKIYSESFDNRKPFEMEYRLRNADGQYRWIIDIGRPFYDLDNKFSGYIGVCFDITERKIAEDGLRRYQLLSQKANDIILFADVNGYVIEANDAAVRAFGYEREDLLGRSIFYLINPDPSLPIGAPSHNANAGGIYYEATAYRYDGSFFTAEVSMQATEIGKSKVLMAILRDTTERKKINEELKKAKESAELANRAKSEFLANMSHEIRTPLNGMTGMIDLTLLTELTTEQRDNLCTAKECAVTLLNLINDILDFSKIEAGKLIIEETSFSIRDLVGNAVKPHIIKAQEKGLNFQYKVSDEIPQVLNGDPHRLKQIINNLLSNAIKFTGAGEVDLEANIISKSHDGITLEFKISDTGIGIAPDEMKHLFISFSQVDSSHTRKYGGTGLGLSITKQLVIKMGGSIWVESTKGKGSTFYFTVKLGIGKFSNDMPITVLPVNKSQNPLEILLAEDDKVNQMVIACMVQEAGHKITIAKNGQEVLDIAKSKKFDLILMDIQMPEMDGIETTRRIREEETYTGRHIPIIAVTAYALKGDKERFLSLGMDGYISKPIEMRTFLNIIEDIVKRPMINKQGGKVVKTDDGITIDKKESDRFMVEYTKRAEPVLRSINENIDLLEFYLNQNNLIEAEKYAHKIKKLSSEISVNSIKTAVFKVELAARRGDISEAIKHFKKVGEEYKKYEGRLHYEDIDR